MDGLRAKILWLKRKMECGKNKKCVWCLLLCLKNNFTSTFRGKSILLLADFLWQRWGALWLPLAMLYFLDLLYLNYILYLMAKRFQKPMNTSFLSEKSSKPDASRRTACNTTYIVDLQVIPHSYPSPSALPHKFPDKMLLTRTSMEMSALRLFSVCFPFLFSEKR